jgi:hypothetical protein
LEIKDGKLRLAIYYWHLELVLDLPRFTSSQAIEMTSPCSPDTIVPNLEDLKAARWESGKVAVAAVKKVAFLQGKQVKVDKKGGTFRCLVCSSAPACGWFVKLARYRGKTGSGDWHVTTADVTGLHAAYPGYAAKSPRVQSIRTLESLVCDTLTTEGL